jgi:hypothetical protein
MAKYIKDPDAVLDYRWDWKAATNGTGRTDWLADGETISTYTVSVPAGTGGLVLDSDETTNNATSVTAWLSAGVAGTDYPVACHIVTSAGREDERTIVVQVRER